MAAGAILRVKKLKGVGIIKTATMHNKRAIQAERGAGGSIDASRSCLNVCLAGPATPDEVAALARARMDAAGVGKLRKDAVRALEFVVSLPPGQCSDEDALFADAVAWLARRFGGEANILSADIHRDEAAPHLHLLLLPIINGRMVGSDAIGGPSSLRALQTAFFSAVCEHYGLRRYPRRLVGASKAAAVAAVLAELRRTNDPALMSALWPALRERIEADPGPFAASLGGLVGVAAAGPNKQRSMTAIFTSKGKGGNRAEPLQTI